MDADKIAQIVEGALLAADGPLTVANLVKLFQPGELDEENASKQIREALKALEEQAQTRGVELKRVASGYRYQVRQELSEWVSRLWDEKPPRYTRALLETLALVAYKQPVTRGDIEQVRGVSVSQNIMRTLLERDWVRVVGQREVPGRPSLYATTKAFLDYFNLKSLDELPPLAEIKAILEPAVEAVAAGEVQNDAPSNTPPPNLSEVNAAGLQEAGHVATPSALPDAGQDAQQGGDEALVASADVVVDRVDADDHAGNKKPVDETAAGDGVADEAASDGQTGRQTEQQTDQQADQQAEQPADKQAGAQVVQLHAAHNAPNSS